MKSIILTPTEIKLIDQSLNQGKAGVMEYTELIIENYFFGVRQGQEKEFPKQGENILKVLNKEIQGVLFDGSGTYDRYSAPTMEKYRAFAQDYIWMWFNLNTRRFEEFMEEHPDYKEWTEWDRPFYEFAGLLHDAFLSSLDYPTSFLDKEEETNPNTKEALDELFEITDFTKKPNK